MRNRVRYTGCGTVMLLLGLHTVWCYLFSIKTFYNTFTWVVLFRYLTYYCATCLNRLFYIVNYLKNVLRIFS